MMKTAYHMRSCIENTVQLRNAVFFVYDKKTDCISAS